MIIGENTLGATYGNAYVQWRGFMLVAALQILRHVRLISRYGRRFNSPYFCVRSAVSVSISFQYQLDLNDYK
jgi:hypothetical protein